MEKLEDFGTSWGLSLEMEWNFTFAFDLTFSRHMTMLKLNKTQHSRFHVTVDGDVDEHARSDRSDAHEYRGNIFAPEEPQLTQRRDAGHVGRHERANGQARRDHGWDETDVHSEEGQQDPREESVKRGHFEWRRKDVARTKTSKNNPIKKQSQSKTIP